MKTRVMTNDKTSQTFPIKFIGKPDNRKHKQAPNFDRSLDTQLPGPNTLNTYAKVVGQYGD